MSIRVASLGSGSSGNSLLVSSPGCHLLLDCGVGIRTITSGLRQFGLDWSDLSGLLLTHEHSDHIHALKPVMKHGVAVYASRGTARGARLSGREFHPIDLRHSFQLDSATIHPVPLSHDAAEPCGFFIELGGYNLALITDTGESRAAFLDPIRSANLVIIEANHDPELLRSGPYPWHLKQRVASATGHLANEMCGDTLRTALQSGERPEIWLAHLSATNNRPHLALASVRKQLGPEASRLSIRVLAARGGFAESTDEPGAAFVQQALV